MVIFRPTPLTERFAGDAGISSTSGFAVRAGPRHLCLVETSYPECGYSKGGDTSGS